MSHRLVTASLTAFFAATVFAGAPAQAQQSYAFVSPPAQQYGPFAAPTAAQPVQPEYEQDVLNDSAQLPPELQRQVVDYPTREAPGTIIVDTPNTYLYLVLGDGKAMRYGIGVGREGFTWSGVKPVARKAEWPDWYPPAEMIARQPYLPRMTAGGPGNPLGARALYLGTSQYRIHGTNDPSTIGRNVSSGCIRLTNEDVTDLYNRVKVGAKVIVLPQAPAQQREARQPARPQGQQISTYAPRERMTMTGLRQSGLY